MMTWQMSMMTLMIKFLITSALVYIYQQAISAYTSFPEQVRSLIFTKLRETRIEVCNMYLFPLYTLLTTCTRMHTLC